MHAKQFLVGVAPSVWEIRLHFVSLQKRPKFPFGPWAIVHGGQKIESTQKIHASRGWCEMHANPFWWAWPLQFGRFGSILFPFKNGQNFPSTMGYIVHGTQKIESVQKIHASRSWCEMNANQFWWVWPLWFRRFGSILFPSKFPFGPWTIVHGGQKIESTQKIHASRGWCEMHANPLWWVWPLWFWRFGSIFFSFKNGQNFPSDHGL